MNRVRNSLLAVVASTAVVAGAHPAYAHAFLDHAEPRVGSTVRGSPQALTLTFTEPVEAKFSRITVTGADDRAVDAGSLEHPAAEVLRVAVPALAPGDYTVHWAVTSIDTHQTEGKYDFTVAP
jgi:methionine-rich copper-binding protein CopC